MTENISQAPIKLLSVVVSIHTKGNIPFSPEVIKKLVRRIKILAFERPTHDGIVGLIIMLRMIYKVVNF